MRTDLSVERVENVFPHLWVVGRPFPPRPLNIQRVLNREIIATTDPSLHLVWTSKKMFVKPLPRYIVSKDFYKRNSIRPSPESIGGLALGLLHSYIALVPTELDFALACDAKLFHEGYTWKDWKDLTGCIHQDHPAESGHDTIYRYIPRRYVHGELRLSRLDYLYRCFQRSWLHGYSPATSKTRYVDFFTDNLAFITVATVYVALVLSAMQVGFETDLTKHESFKKASYGFTIFAIFSPVIAVGAIVTVVLLVFMANLWRTIFVQQRRYHSLGIRLSLERQQSSEVATRMETLTRVA